jgi:hypothetical protein
MITRVFGKQGAGPIMQEGTGHSKDWIRFIVINTVLAGYIKFLTKSHCFGIFSFNLVLYSFIK